MAIVHICTPHGGNVPPSFFRAIFAVQNQTLQHTFLYGEVDMMIVGKARNDLVRQAIAQKADLVWFIDDDVIVPPNAGILIDQCLELGVVSGLYFNRRPPYTPQLYSLATDVKHYNPDEPLYWPLDTYNPGLQTVDAAGGGCLLIRMDVFEKLSTMDVKRKESAKEAITHLQAVASFIDDEDQKNTAQTAIATLQRPVPPLSPWFEFTDTKGEDLYFCERLREAGIPLWVNTDVKCDHMGYVPIGEAQFSYLKSQGLIKRVEA